MNIKELFYEVDTRKHQQLVAKIMLNAVRMITDRAVNHDASKLYDSERRWYVNPVYRLNTEKVPYGSDYYKELTEQMGPGWEHHQSVNDHHVSEVNQLKTMSLISLLEMCCDWIAASRRQGNDPALPLDSLVEKSGMGKDLQEIIKNTLVILDRA